MRVRTWRPTYCSIYSDSEKLMSPHKGGDYVLLSDYSALAGKHAKLLDTIKKYLEDCHRSVSLHNELYKVIRECEGKTRASKKV